MPCRPHRVTGAESRIEHATTARTTSCFPALAILCLSLAACAPGETGKERSPASEAAPSQPPSSAAAVTAADSLDVARTVERFDSLLVAGDSGAALALLAPEAVVLESGGMETREQYRGHHLPADIAFLRAVRTTRDPLHVIVRGDVAWTAATSITQGTFRDRPVNSAGAALMVLTREPGGWRIRAIHWSSHARKK